MKPWDPHNLLADTSQIRFLRQSTIGSGDICLQRMGYDLDPHVTKGTGEARIVGTAYHAGLEWYYRHRLEHGFFTIGAQAMGGIHDAALQAFVNERDTHPDIVWATTENDAWSRVLSMIDTYFGGCHEWPSEYAVLGVEQEWFLPMPGRPGWALKGTIDLVLWGSSGYVLADHKTAGRKWKRGKEDPRSNNQAPLYCWATEQARGHFPYAFTFDVMTYAGDFDRKWTRPTQVQVDAVLRKARSLTHIVEAVPLDLLPTNPSSNLCSEQYCDHWERCPAGAIAAQVS